jgi:hypothetical protein
MDVPRMCPSAPGAAGAILLGIVRPDGTIAYLKDRMVVTTEFVRSARLGRAPESRFRFSSACVEDACMQWDGAACRVPGALSGSCSQSDARDLPACSIRRDCRWFTQAGPTICMACRLVVTRNEMTDTSTNRQYPQS